MRTTVNLDAALIERAKVIAAGAGQTFSEVIADAVRESMARRDRQVRSGVPVELPVDRSGGGTLPGVNLDSTADLLDYLDSVEGPVR